MSVKKNQIIPLQITSLSSDGNGVGRYNGMAIFVPFTAVGDEADVRVVKVCKHHAFGIIETLHQPGADREKPVCPIFSKCGGCQFQHLTYHAELDAKEQFVRDAMLRIGDIDHPVSPILPSPLSARYRNKVQYPLTRDESGAVIAGFYAGRSHRVIPCTDCILQPRLLNEIARTLCALLTQYHISVYREETHTGLVRHLYLRHAITTNQVLVCLVCNGSQLPHSEEICRDLTARHPEVCSIVLNVNRQQTNVITGLQCISLFGNGLLADEMAGVPVELGPLSFYQVNTRGANQLYSVVQTFAELTGKELLLDLYCGAGTIGLSMAAQCQKLIGVEIIPQAVESARQNAERMGVRHAEFFCADAGQAAQRLAAQSLHPDVIVLDPPRKGCDSATLQAVLQMNPPKIVMVSCNVSTAARDVRFLCENGYQVQAIQPVDMFPRTKHVETVVLLSRETNPLTVEVRMEVETGEVKEHPTYKRIQEYVQEKYGFKVHTAYIAEVKRMVGLDMHKAPNAVEQRKHEYHPCPPEKVEAIKDALRHFGLIAE